MPIAHWRTGVLQRPECMYASVCTCTVHFPLVTAQAPAAKHSNLVALQSCTVYCSLPHHLTGVDEQICLTPSPTPCLAAAPLHTCSPISHESCFVHPPKATEPNGVPSSIFQPSSRRNDSNGQRSKHATWPAHRRPFRSNSALHSARLDQPDSTSLTRPACLDSGTHRLQTCQHEKPASARPSVHHDAYG